jgi:hypothetical protein
VCRLVAFLRNFQKCSGPKKAKKTVDHH